ASALLSGSTLAEIPQAGLAAEGRGDFAVAAQIYREQLQQAPDDVALWQRLSEVEATQGNANAAADALGEAARLVPDSAERQAAHSRALSVANRPAEALTAIQRALAIEPDNVDYLIDQATLANWNQNTELARQSLQRAIDIGGERTDLLDDLARSQAWQGDLRKAGDTMDRYLQQQPDDRAAALDAARFLAWRGDYAGALERLNGIEKSLGSDDESQALRARLLAWAGFPKAAQAINSRLLAAHPGDYDHNYTEALIRRQSYRPRVARPFIDSVQATKPEAKETSDLVRSSKPILDSRVSAFLDWAGDSQDVDHHRLGANLDLAAGEAFRLLAGVERNRVGAPLDSPFAAVTGDRWVDVKSAELGLRYGFNDDAALTARVGRSRIDGLDGRNTWDVALDLRPDDHWHLTLSADRDRLDASPRSLTLGLSRREVAAKLNWRPDLRWNVDVWLRRDAISDGNDMTAFDIAARRAIRRGQRFHLDLGGAAAFQRFDHDPGNGYYAPDNYRRLQATGFGYWHISDNVGLNISAALGVQRDETLPSWKSANDLSLELVTGIFSDWELRLRGAYSERRQVSGAFDAQRFGIVLERRF
ncbi:MAG: hypothetical protein KDI78_11105, partial [Xanthomonadales bacterium]|nr:hypothetical protein [Xanthomonadales bacterium]